MSRREKRGDWPIEVEVLDDEEAGAIKYDPAPEPSVDDARVQKAQRDAEKRHGHPAARAFEEDDD